MRMFIAVQVSMDVQGRAARLIQQLERGGVEARWAPAEDMHITLNFLGEVRSQRSMEICRAVRRGVAGFDPFDFSCVGAGGFPNADRPRVLWMGVGDGYDELVRLQAALEVELAEVGFRPESRKYSPHLTIGRMKRSRDEASNVGPVLAELADFQGGESYCDEVILYASELDRRHGPTYHVLGRVGLGKEVETYNDDDE